MAKQIKVIKCPQCGSVNKSQIKEDHYICSNCGTEYFLDNDDITINHNVNVNNTRPNPANTNNTNKVVKIVGIIFGSIIFLNIIISLLGAIFSSKSSDEQSYSSYESEPVKKEEVKVVWDDPRSYFFESADKKPVIVVVGYQIKERDFSQDAKKVYAGFYEGITGKEIKITDLGFDAKKIDVKYRQFDDNNLYFTFNDTKWFVVDKQLLEVKEVPSTMYQNIPELQAGIAKIEFVYEGNGSGFNIMSNEGKQLYYYPIIQKIYNKDKFYDANQGFTTIPSNTPIQAGFEFTRQGHDFPEEIIQLIKYHHKNPKGYPQTHVSFGWHKDFGGSGIFTDADPYKKVLINSFMKNQGRIVDFKDFTPGRLYFSPSVWTWNDKHVLISFKPTPAEDAVKSLQLLNAETGEVIWTHQLVEDGYLSNVSEYEDGFCYTISSDRFVFLDKDGKLVADIRPTKH